MNIPRTIIAAVVVLSAFCGINFYIARRLYQWLGLLSLNMNVKVFAGIYILLAISLLFGFLPLPPGVRSVFAWIGAYWIGIFVYLLIFTLISDVSLFLGSAVRIVPNPTPQSALFFKGLFTVLLTAGVVCYGMFNAGHIKHVSYDILQENASLSGLRIVMISDTHLGAVGLTDRNLERIVESVNALEPDIVCITGDIFNDDIATIRDSGGTATRLRSIESTYGVYACLGNHDGGLTLERMISFLEDCNITLLKDEYEIIDSRLALFGRLDSSPIGGSGGFRRRDISDTIASIGAEFPVVVMEHNPSHIGEYGADVLLILSGHTHRGQMYPGSLVTRAIFTADYGHYRKDSESPHVIVTSGVSTWGPPMRVGTNNEIVSIILR